MRSTYIDRASSTYGVHAPDTGRIEAEVRPSSAEVPGGWFTLTLGDAEVVVYVRDDAHMDRLVSVLEAACREYQIGRAHV